jgi:hypothetical protein
MYLVDTNVWLERLLDQERATEVGRFLDRTPTDRLSMTDFSLHSIGVILGRLGHRKAFSAFVDDVFLKGGVELVSLRPDDMDRLVAIMEEYKLDFDDAYQYVAAERSEAVIISFDAHFDGTERGRQAPGAALR